LRSFGLFFPFWYVWTNKNLATLLGSCRWSLLQSDEFYWTKDVRFTGYRAGLPDFCWYNTPKWEEMFTK
jgi:hypothetical protein